MSPDEWKVFHDTIALAQTQIDLDYPGKLSVWEAGADLHNKLADEIHWACQFFPWHRLFLTSMERKLQKINPKFYFPWWNSAAVWDKPESAPIWKYVGTNGNSVNGDIFGGKPLHEGTSNNPLRRDYTSLAGLPAQEVFSAIYQKSLKKGGFKEWSQDMEVQHGYLHYIVGGENGQLFSMYSPLDPIFYMHHAHMDFLYVQAQSGWVASKLGASSQLRDNCDAKYKLSGFNNLFGEVMVLRPNSGYFQSLLRVCFARTAAQTHKQCGLELHKSGIHRRFIHIKQQRAGSYEQQRRQV
jgi:Common central domain of tyrosinase